jgi:putative spermidine/putrescine transport system substrate-binding protein
MRSPIVAGCGIVIFLAGCSEQSPPPAAPQSMEMDMDMASLAPEGQLDIVAWPDYIERGESDKAYDWVTQFEADSGCKVEVKVVSSADEMIAAMKSGGPPPSPPGDASWPPAGNAPYDLVIASGDVSLRLIRDGVVQPIGIERLPAYSTIEPPLQQASWHFVDGKHYGVPFQWGPNLLMYDTRTFKTPPPSWSVVFEEQKLPDGKSNQGRVQAHGQPIYIADAALYLAARRPNLGITDPYELNPAQFEEVLQVLRGQRPLVQRYWHDANLQVRDFQNEGIVASGSRAFQANTLLANKAPVATTVPQEGATGWADSTMLAAGARHPNCAYKWMEWSLTARVQGDVAAWTGSNPVVPKACEGNELLGADGCRKNGMEHFARIRFWRTPEAACKSSPEGCVPYSRWETEYAALTGGK